MKMQDKSTDKRNHTITIPETQPVDGQVGGKLEMTEDVVASIAMLSARPIKGIHSVGRAGLLRKAMGQHPTRGISAEVGEKQAALDIEHIEGHVAGVLLKHVGEVGRAQLWEVVQGLALSGPASNAVTQVADQPIIAGPMVHLRRLVRIPRVLGRLRERLALITRDISAFPSQ